jgi:hypothetical protein
MENLDRYNNVTRENIKARTVNSPVIYAVYALWMKYDLSWETAMMIAVAYLDDTVKDLTDKLGQCLEQSSFPIKLEERT